LDNEADIDTRTFISSARTNTQRENCNRYQNIPFQYGNGLKDVCLEDSLRGSIRDSKKKSIGFRNAFENQFDYISEDIYDPNHTVFEYARNSRGNNKQIARPNSESIRTDRMMRNSNMNRNTTNY
jgi:hypothetical protein